MSAGAVPNFDDFVKQRSAPSGAAPNFDDFVKQRQSATPPAASPDWRDRILNTMNPEPNPGNDFGTGARNFVKGAGQAIATPILHPVDTAMGAAKLAGQTLTGGADFRGLPNPETVRPFINQAQHTAENPAHAAGEIAGPAAVTAGLGAAIPKAPLLAGAVRGGLSAAGDTWLGAPIKIAKGVGKGFQEASAAAATPKPQMISPDLVEAAAGQPTPPMLKPSAVPAEQPSAALKPPPKEAPKIPITNMEQFPGDKGGLPVPEESSARNAIVQNTVRDLRKAGADPDQLATAKTDAGIRSKLNAVAAQYSKQQGYSMSDKTLDAILDAMKSPEDKGEDLSSLLQQSIARLPKKK